MKLKFNDNLDYQKDAIQAVVDIFEGEIFGQSSFGNYRVGDLGLSCSEFGFKNNMTLDDEQLFKNTKSIQKRNNIKEVDSLKGKNFSIEMETGTGKTYVYLRTIFELHKVYGFAKFIIVVPSVAIREGVLKSIKITKEHFRGLYKTSCDPFVYDSADLRRINDFACSDKLQIMILNIQSFHKKDNIFNMGRETYDTPKDLIASTSPIVIIDEPQSMDGPQSQEAIKSLKAAVILRYSATHRDFYNLLYTLGPVQAYRDRLVKHIEVASVQTKNDYNSAYVKLLRTDCENGIRARLEIHKASKSGKIKPTKIWVKRGDNLFTKSAKHYVYSHNYLVQKINCMPDDEYIEFNDGHPLRCGQGIGGQKDTIMKEQISETIKQHLEKERFFKENGVKVKVLSLFFIDKVSNYRIYSNDSEKPPLGKIGQWFEEEFKRISSQPEYDGLILDSVESIHKGYFSGDKRKKDTTGTTKDDDDTYNLIMKDKELLLSFNVPLRFIFSHSALREGWDNPNVFQICTLNETKSTSKKRQEIGRGLRLPVNADGCRIHDENINRLTVIVNESYEDFAKGLQNELERDYGVKFDVGTNVSDAHKIKVAKLNQDVLKGNEFKEFWGKIKHKTIYRTIFDTDELIKDVVERIEKLEVESPHTSVKCARINIEKTGVSASERSQEPPGHKMIPTKALPDVITFLEKKTKLTRSTLAKILKESHCFEKFSKNPQAFMLAVSDKIDQALRNLMIKGIKYEKNNHYWEMTCLEKDSERICYPDKEYKVKNKEKSLFDLIKTDSIIESVFARDLDNTRSIKLFIKLPRWFRIDTPIGSYNPDWAFVDEREEKLYFVAETKKDPNNEENLRGFETYKIECAKKHFETIGVNYKTVEKLSEILNC